MFNDKGLNLKLNCSKTGQIFDMSASRIENNKVIYTSCLDLPFKIGDQIVRTWEDGYEEKFTILGISKNKLWPRLTIEIR
ncbi:hypothetical protein ACMHYC_10855 [Acinetobacter courvalinii]|uniref:hypothetical protein n=1 Tax=Acinetobacter courvalinii TaxID=280147 RepID=UPI0039C97137